MYFQAAERSPILIDRGWIPFSGFRDKLPDISFPGDVDVEITGRVDELRPQASRVAVLRRMLTRRGRR